MLPKRALESPDDLASIVDSRCRAKRDQPGCKERPQGPTCASDRVSGAPSGFWARPKSAEDVHWGARWRRNSSSVVSPFLSSNDRLAGESLKGAWGHDGLQRSSRARDRSHRRARVNRLAWDHATAFVLRPRRRTRKRARVDRGKPSLS